MDVYGALRIAYLSRFFAAAVVRSRQFCPAHGVGLNSLNHAFRQDLLRLDTRSFLAAFGAGNATPGSGSAAAFNGALACELLSTTAKLTRARCGGNERRRLECEYVLKQVEDRKPALHQWVQRDSDVFSEAIAARRARDTASDKVVRRRHSERAHRRLITATEIAVQIAKECVALGKLGLLMVEIGYSAAKGDPALAVSNAIAGCRGAASAALVNLKKSRGGKWGQAAYSELSGLLAEAGQIEMQLLNAIAGLRQEVDESMSRQLRLF